MLIEQKLSRKHYCNGTVITGSRGPELDTSGG